MQGEASGISEAQREYIRKQTKVYGKDPTKKLTPWHAKVNNAAYELALSDQNILLLPKQELIEAAQKKSVIKATTLSKARVVLSTFTIQTWKNCHHLLQNVQR